MADEKIEIDPKVAEALAATPGDTQLEWTNTPEGQAYLAKADEREKIEQERAEREAASTGNVPEPINTDFHEVDDSDEETGEDGNDADFPVTGEDSEEPADDEEPSAPVADVSVPTSDVAPADEAAQVAAPATPTE